MFIENLNFVSNLVTDSDKIYALGQKINEKIRF